MARPTVAEKLTADAVLEVVLPNNMVIPLSYEGLGLSGVSDGPPTKNYVSVGGIASYAMRYGSDKTRTWAPAATVGWADTGLIPTLPANAANEPQTLDTGLLFDYAGHKLQWRFYPEGKTSGKESRIGYFWLVPAKARNGNKMMISITGRPAPATLHGSADLVIGTVA